MQGNANYPKINWKLYVPVKGETLAEKKERLHHAEVEKKRVLRQRARLNYATGQEERLKNKEKRLKNLEEKLQRKEERLCKKEDILDRREKMLIKERKHKGRNAGRICRKAFH
ncbi:hypothetical protein TVAG_081940 [Trichomonas vaginalis G3]|uniref:Uncharacterized protein n=1 Tax=Trichomonas vaginalis (strain ATCC PRA-98 / G3) TaxID=412133 RepID=A2E6Y6_TRIV3|nr:hypothetical protein TVAGG3_0492780 [Trichomonas vaginalis G3]EAY11622.1 hypothetical protein TVAG_081940 [Trichomonas vaginalis G3]KAI5516497.1 hypothetical protein TVAGG3_0492780 [Trichomonas vaginalis G3]|eukprot:XP_001323845.1 hypothetical protein [Trichomonas vaginalis G3]